MDILQVYTYMYIHIEDAHIQCSRLPTFRYARSLLQELLLLRRVADCIVIAHPRERLPEGNSWIAEDLVACFFWGGEGWSASWRRRSALMLVIVQGAFWMGVIRACVMSSSSLSEGSDCLPKASNRSRRVLAFTRTLPFGMFRPLIQSFVNIRKRARRIEQLGVHTEASANKQKHLQKNQRHCRMPNEWRKSDSLSNWLGVDKSQTNRSIYRSFRHGTNRPTRTRRASK